MKIEFYTDEKAKGTRSRKRMGHREINLSDYIDKGPVIECLRLDTGGKNSQYAYITMKFEVAKVDEEKDEVLREEEMTTTLLPPSDASKSELPSFGEDSSDDG